MNQLALYDNKGAIAPLFDGKKLALLKSTICKGATDDEFELFLHACQRTGLDPFMKQIYAVKRYDSMTIQTGIDGYRLIAERTGKYSPGREPTYQYDESGNIISATAYLKKMTADGTWHEIASTAFFKEYCQKTKEGKLNKFWIQFGHVMIAKCAEALALRKAFPGDLSGIYTKEEMQQSEVDTVEVVNDHIPVTTKMVDANSRTNVDHIEDKHDMPQKLMTTNVEWKEIESLLNPCTPKFQENLLNRWLDLGIKSYSDLDMETFIKSRKACLDHIKKRKSKDEANPA